MRPQLVLSLFPGIDGLGMAFEESGFTVVRGPDLLWGGRIEDFHVLAGRFDGIIGGPPCVGESALAYLPHGRPGYSLKGEFDRCVTEAQPAWWVMEAVIRHEAPFVLKLSPRWLGEMQSRRRWFHSNVDLSCYVEGLSCFEHPVWKAAVTGMQGGGYDARPDHREARTRRYTIAEMCELQGLPGDFGDSLPFDAHGKRKVLGNMVPLPMGRAVAKAIRRWLEEEP